MVSNPVNYQPSSDQSSRKKKKNTMFSFIFDFSDLPVCLIGPATSMASYAEQPRSNELYLPLQLLPHARKKG